MKKIIISLVAAFGFSSNAFATGSVECTVASGQVSVIGTIGAGSTLLEEMYVDHPALNKVLTLDLSMNWLDYDKKEIKAVSYNAMEDVTRLVLKVENGKGTMSLNLADMPGGEDIIINNVGVDCIFE